MLAQADNGSREGLEAWFLYVLQGILNELRKVDRLANFSYLSAKILTPALSYAKERELITVVLHIAAHNGVAKAADFVAAMPGMTAAQRTYQIKKLVERNILQPIKDGARQYTIGFSGSYLMRGVIQALSKEGFIASVLTANESP